MPCLLYTSRLLSKASGGNGQIRYGADVINRIIEQGKPGGRKKLQDAILTETLVPLLQTLCTVSYTHLFSTEIITVVFAVYTYVKAFSLSETMHFIKVTFRQILFI